MVTCKRFITAGLWIFISASMVMGQSSGGLGSAQSTQGAQTAQSGGASNEEMSVEESYLQDAVERMIIQEQARAESRDMKLVALRYIEDAIGRGNSGPEIQAALDYLSLEGVMNKTRENGRLVNNYPDVRARAATYLGELGTEEAKNTLLKMVMADPEPMVLTEAIKSLAKIGLNENEETANAISWIVTRFDVLNPDNLVALSALDAYEILAEKTGGIKDPNTIRTIIRIAEGPYIRPVQDRAKGLLAQMMNTGGSRNGNQSSSSTQGASQGSANNTSGTQSATSGAAGTTR